MTFYIGKNVKYLDANGVEGEVQDIVHSEEMRKLAARNTKTLYAPVPTAIAPMVTFIDDDSQIDYKNITQPIYDSKGIKSCIAVPSTEIAFTVNTRAMTNDEVLDLQANHNVEILAHTKTHQDLTKMTVDQLEIELGECKEVLISKGYKVRGIAYPFGANNALVRKIASKYYEFGVDTLAHLNTKPVKAYQVSRVSFGAYTNGNNTLDFYKSKVDDAIANNGWTIFVTHSWNTDYDATQQQYLSDTIDYIKSKGVSIVTASEGWDILGNVLEVEGKYVITKQGEVYSNGIKVN